MDKHFSMNEAAQGVSQTLAVKTEVFTLDEGDVVLQWPERLSPKSLEDFEDWWKIMLRKIKRAATSPLEKEFQHFLDHHEELVDEHNGKYVVIKDRRVLGVYDDQNIAITETIKDHELGTFIVQLATPGNSAYTQTFHSRVAF